MRVKRLYDYRAFHGCDISNEISLFEYGLLWKCTNKRKQEYKFIYGTEQEERECNEICYSRFDCGVMSLKNWQELCHESWFELEKVADYSGQTSAEFVSNFPYSVHTAIQYHGTENLFGLSYYEGIEISGCLYAKKGAKK